MWLLTSPGKAMSDVLPREQRTFECRKSAGSGSLKTQHQSSEWLVPWKVQSTANEKERRKKLLFQSAPF